MKHYIETERVDLFEPNIMIAMKVSIKGDAEDNDLERAIHVAINANEILNTRIVLESNGKAYYEKVDNAKNKVIISDEPWQDIFNKEKKVRFKFEEGEYIRAYILHEDCKKQLFILSHHLAGDGKSITYFIQDIMNALSGKDISLRKINLLPESKLPTKSKIPILYKMYINHYNRLWKRNEKFFSIDDYKSIHKHYWDTHNTALITEHFSKIELERLIDKTKKAQVTLTSYIMTEFFRLKQDKIAIGLAVDARLDNNQNMGNQTTGIEVDYIYNKKISFEENARNIQMQMKQKLNSIRKKYFVLHFMASLDCNLVDSIFAYLSGLYKNKISKKIASDLGYSKNIREIGITNLTRLDISFEYGEYKITDFLFIPPIVSYAKRIIGLVTLGDEMNISYNIFEDKELEKEKNYFKMIMEEIKK